MELPIELEWYLVHRKLEPVKPLGEGKDGAVWRHDGGLCAKIHHVRDVYFRELHCYRRLRARRIRHVLGLRVPQLIDHDDDRLIIEMSIVTPPFLLDFASAYLDTPPDFPAEVLTQWHEELEGRFGPRYGDVLSVLNELKRTAGIHLFDVHADNLKFER
ncbi:MAG: hypothetical protein AAGD32_17170 [Planctomycetota bacterium]